MTTRRRGSREARVDTKIGQRGFTLIELLVVIAVLAILAALLFPVFSSAKQSGKRATCLSNVREIGIAASLYLSDSGDVYPQTRQFSAQPAVDDVAGEIDEPIYASALDPLQPYLGSGQRAAILSCPEDSDPFGRRCQEIDPDSPEVTSYLVNGFFVFGLSESAVTNSSSTIYLAERRSVSGLNEDPYCDDIYHPWFDASNDQAPEDEMEEKTGAIATDRHLTMANYDFADGHAKALPWGSTYAPPRVDLHLIQQP